MSHGNLMSLLLLVAVVMPPETTVTHVGISSTDVFVECATRLLQKRVFTTVWASPGATVGCSSEMSRQDLTDNLRHAGFALIEGEQGALLFPIRTAGEGLWSGVEPSKFEILATVKAFLPAPKGSTVLTDSDRRAIAKEIMSRARSVPLAPEVGPSSASRAISVPLILQLDAHELKPGIKSIIAIWGQARGDKRIIYGEMKNGVYVALWDSPLVAGGDFGLGYEDVDLDGSLEIVVTARAFKDGEQVTIFRWDGEEITRQSCPDDEFSGGENAGRVCPIVGRTISFVRSSRVPVEIDTVSYKRNDGNDPDRYLLRRGHYKLAPPAFWKPRSYDFNVGTKKKYVEKLNYIHRHPVRRGLVNSPELWPWSSFGHYRYGEEGPVKVGE